MRIFLFTTLTVFTLKAFSQKIIISGTAFDTTNGRNWVRIVVNDTLRKFRESKLPNWEVYKKLTEDTTVNISAKGDGKFQVSAYKTDSIFFTSFRHIQKVYSVSELLALKKIDIRLDPEICIPYVRCKDTLPSNFYIFVGQKLQVNYEQTPYYCNVITMDTKYRAVYKILKQEYGKYAKDTINFTVFDHYGRPAFSKYENVLLFVSEYCGELYHEKYQYFDLYKTIDGKWASPGDPYKYDQYHRKNLKAQNIQFEESVWFDIGKVGEAAVKEQFPSPFYRIDGQKAYPVMGSYIDDLISVKKEGVLNARNIILK